MIGLEPRGAMVPTDMITPLRMDETITAEPLRRERQADMAVSATATTNSLLDINRVPMMPMVLGLHSLVKPTANGEPSRISRR